MPTAPKSSDIVPLDAIGLADAFERYYQATSPDAKTIETDLEAAYAEHEKARREAGAAKNRSELRQLNKRAEEALRRWNSAFDASEESRRRAEISFRESQCLTALIRDPMTGQILQLSDHRSWTERTNFGVAGFVTNFVGPYDLTQPGPDTILNGVQCPVFFKRAEFMASLPGSAATGIKSNDATGERWPIPGQEPRSKKQAHAWRIARRKYPNGGPPKSLSWQEITNSLNANRIERDAPLVGRDTVRRMFSSA